MINRFAIVAIALAIIIMLNSYEIQTAEKPIPHDGSVQTEKSRPGHLLIPPRNFDPNKEYPLFIFIHGLGDCPRCISNSFYGLMTNQEYYILIPEGPLPYEDGFSWYRLNDLEIFRNDAKHAEALINRMIDRIVSRYKIDRNKIYLGGFSQGGRLSFFIGLRNPDIISKIMPMGGVYMDNLLDGYLDSAKSLEIDIFHGTKDEVNSFSTMQEAYKKLLSAGMKVSMMTYPLGHTFDEAVLKSVLQTVK